MTFEKHNPNNIEENPAIANTTKGDEYIKTIFLLNQTTIIYFLKNNTKFNYTITPIIITFTNFSIFSPASTQISDFLRDINGTKSPYNPGG